MEFTILLMVLVLLIAVGAGLVLIVFRLGSKPQDTTFLVMQQQLDAFREQMNQQLAAVTQQLQTTTGLIGSRLDNAAKVVGEVRQNLGELSKATQQVFDVGKDIASLQEILRAPKLRGMLGELFLGDLLGQILPPNHFTLQHRFKSGETVDAVVRLSQFLVPVDSKFPLENFRRLMESQNDEERKAARKKFAMDVKKHIDAIADKYILPDEGTFPFALMYIPAENVYYETIIKDENLGDEKSLSAYSLQRKVIPVSPNSLYAYLQAIVLGLKGLKIEQSALFIINHLERLRGDFERFRKEFEVIGSHLTNAKSKYDEADRRLERLGDRLLTAPESALGGKELPSEGDRSPRVESPT
ncbi:MAG TPA: DNA recombination protein RmuC [Nitrospiria bacterium]|nr:DNA recombination protein RmuC [Nitrospiria bacterium]